MGSLIEQYEQERRQQQRSAPPDEPQSDLIREYEAERAGARPTSPEVPTATAEPERETFLSRAIRFLNPMEDFRRGREAAEQLGTLGAAREAIFQSTAGVAESGLTMAKGLGRITRQDWLRSGAEYYRRALPQPETEYGEQLRGLTRFGADIAPYVVMPEGAALAVNVPKVARFIPFAERVRKLSQAESLTGRIAWNVATSTPADVAFAAAEPESSFLGAVGQISGSEGIQQAAENPYLRVAAEIGFGAVAATGVEAFLASRRAARAAKAVGVPEARPTQPADVLGEPIPPVSDEIVPPRAEPESAPRASGEAQTRPTRGPEPSREQIPAPETEPEEIRRPREYDAQSYDQDRGAAEDLQKEINRLKDRQRFAREGGQHQVLKRVTEELNDLRGQLKWHTDRMSAWEVKQTPEGVRARENAPEIPSPVEPTPIIHPEETNVISAPTRATGEVPTTPESVVRQERPDVRTPGPTGNPPIKATSGHPDVVTFPNGKKVTFRYRLVDAADLKPSHDALSFERNANYPKDVQGRAYHRDKSAQVHVIQGAQQLDADQLVRDTGNAEGPPLITSDGILVAGNGRTMMIQRAARMSPEAFERYRGILRAKAQSFGIDPALVDEFRSPVLVREIDDATIDTRDVASLARLNDMSDMSQVKARDEASEGMARAKRLGQSPTALRFLRETFGAVADDPKKGTLGAILSDPAKGRDLLRILTQEGVIPQAEQAKYFSGAEYGGLTKDGKALIENMLYAGAIGDPDAYARARSGIPSILRKLDTSLPALFEANADPAYSIATELRDALDVAKAMKAQKVTTAKMLKAQGDAFSQDRSPMADVLAEILVSDKKANVAQLMSRYAKLAGEHARMNQTADMFGYSPLGKEDLFYNVFHGERNALLDAADRDPAIGGGFFGMDPSQGQLFDAPIHPRQTPKPETRAAREARALKEIEQGPEDLDVAQRGLDLGAKPMEAEHYIGDFYGRGDFDIYSIRRLDQYYFEKYAIGSRSGRKDLNAWLTQYPSSTHVALIRRVPDGMWFMAPIGPGSLDELRAWARTMARLEPGEMLPPIPGKPHRQVEGYERLGSEYKYDEGEGATQVGLTPPTFPASSRLPYAYPFKMGTATKVENPLVAIDKLEKAMRFMSTGTGGAGVATKEGGLPRGMRSALGVAHSIGRYVRVKSLRNLDVRFHELGHIMHSVLLGLRPNGSLDPDMLKPFVNELRALTGGVKTKRGGTLVEGWAEYWRLYLDNPDVLPQVAPQLHSFAQSRLRFSLPEVEKYLDELRKSWREYKEASPRARVHSSISWKPSRHWGIRNALLRLHADVVDEHRILEKLEDLVTRQPWHQRPFGSAADMARLVAGSDAIADHWLHQGSIDFKTGHINGPSMEEILEPISKASEEVRFQEYMHSRRVVEVTEPSRPRGPIETGTRREDALAVVQEEDALAGRLKDAKGNPISYAEVFEQMQEFNRKLRQYLVDADVLSPQAAKLWEETNKNYNPLFRVRDIVPGSSGIPFGGGTAQLVNIPNPIKSLGGSGQDVIAPLESWVRNVYVYARVAARRDVEKKIIELAKMEGAGAFGLRMDATPPLRKTRVAGDEGLRWLKDQGVDLEALGVEKDDIEDLAQTFFDVFRPETGREPFIRYRDASGAQKYIEVDKELFDYFMGSDRHTLHWSIRFLAAPFARLLRAGATLSPEFALRNPQRDVLTALVQAKGGFNPFDFVRGLYSSVAKDDVFWAWMRSGGGRSSLLASDRAGYRDAVKRMIGEKRTLRNVVLTPLDMLRAFSETMENATRVGVFAKQAGVYGNWRFKGDPARIASMSKQELLEAGLASREGTVDFSVHGAKLQGMRAMAAFWNATVQGYRQMYRSFRKNPKGWAMKGFGLITLPTAYLMYVNHDNEDYWEVPQWERDLYWLVPRGINPETGKTDFWRVPKPFELGWIFGTLPEHLFEFSRTQDPHELKRTLVSFITSLGGGLLPVPTVLYPLIEVVNNQSYRFHRKIVPEGMQRLEPDRQVKSGTSEVARQTQRFLQLPLSPIQIDHLLQGYGGGLARLGADVVDVAVGRQKFKPTGRGVSVRDITEVPGIRGLVVPDYTETSETLNRFYVELEKMRRAKATFDDIAENDPELLDERIRRDPGFEERAAMAPDFEAVAEQIAEIRRAIGEVRRDEQMDRDEKRRQINALAQEMNVLAAELVQRRTPASPGRR